MRENPTQVRFRRYVRDEVGGGVDLAVSGGFEQVAGVDVVLAEQVAHRARHLAQTFTRTD
jgi:hypothetical protein